MASPEAKMTNERVDLLRLAADDCEAEANNQLREAPNLGPTKEQRNRMDAANIMKRVAALRLWADEMERSVEPKAPLECEHLRSNFLYTLPSKATGRIRERRMCLDCKDEFTVLTSLPAENRGGE